MLAPRVGALRERDHLPAPLEDRRVLEAPLACELLGNGGAVVPTFQLDHAAAVVLDDREVVLGVAPDLIALPAVGNALDAHRELRPVFDEQDVGRPRRGGEEEGGGQHRGPGPHAPYDTFIPCRRRPIRSASTNGSGPRASSRRAASRRRPARAARWT